MTAKQVAIRVGTEGKAQVVRDWQDMEDGGTKAYRSTASAADQASAAADRYAASLQRQAEKARLAQGAQDSQRNFNAVLGVGGDIKSAAGSASVFQEQIAAMEALEARAAALRAQIDPLSVAQGNLTKATKNADGLLAAGAISTAEHSAATKLAEAEYKVATETVKRMGAAHALSSMQTMMLQSAVFRTGESLAAGMPIWRILVQQGGEVGAALGMGGGGVGGVMRIVGSVAGSFWGILGGGAATFIALGLQAEAYNERQQKLNTTLLGAGAASRVSLTALTALAAEQAKALSTTRAGAQDMDVALLNTGRASQETLGKAKDAARSLMALTGVDVKGATQTLAKLFEDPAKGAADLNAKLNFLNPAELDHIKSLEDQGNRSAALTEALDKLTGAGAGLERHLGLWASLGNSVASAFGNAGDGAAQFFGRLLNLPAADPAKRVADIQADIIEVKKTLDLFNRDTPGALDDLYAKMAKAKADLKAQTDRQSKAANDQGLVDFRGLIDAADPAIAKISEVQARIDGLKAKRAAFQGNPDLKRSSSDIDNAIAASEKELKDLNDRAKGVDKHTESLQRQLAAMRADTTATLAAADAYLKSSAAGQTAEVRAKALTDATKKGADVAAWVSAQERLAAAQTIEQGAAKAAGLRDESDARGRLFAQVDAGKLSIDQANKQLQIENALRPLTIAALKLDTAERAKALAIVKALRGEMERSNADQAHEAVDRTLQSDKDRVAQLQIEIAEVNDLTGARERHIAALRAEQQARNAGANPLDQTAAAASAANVTDLETAARKAKYIADYTRSQADSLALAQAEISVIGKSQLEHDLVIDRLKIEQALKQQGIDLSSDEAKRILDQAAAIDQLTDKQRHLTDNMNELKTAGESFIDDVLNPSNWTTWGDFGKRILQDVASEMLKLAAINPLKNALFKEQLPTLGGVGNALGNLFGGGLPVPIPEFYASGTDYAAGGMAWVGEQGPEKMYVPRGSRIINAAQSAASASGAGVAVQFGDININAPGADAAGLTALRSEVVSLRRGLTQTIITTVNDQAQRGTISMGRRR